MAPSGESGARGSSLGTFVGGTRGKNERGEDLFTFDIVDLDTGALSRAELDFLGHGVAFDPTTRHGKNTAVVFEKRGPGGALVDLDRAIVLSPILASPGRAFYGHAAYDAAGSKLFVVESDLATHAGVITVRDPATFHVLGEFPSHGQAPHDCILVGTTLVITNGGGDLEAVREEPSVTYVDTSDARLLERFTFADSKINAGHIALRSNGDFVVSSAPRAGLPETTSLGGVTIRAGKTKCERMKLPKATVARMLGESLSVAIDEDSGIACVTNPHGNIVTFWDVSKRKLVRSLDLEFPRGVALTRNGKSFVISVGKAPPTLLEVDIATFAQAPFAGAPSGVMSGSHLFPWERRA
ncbi:MAG: DUF1513 domain-containing protein [Polyangiaceae bacterium]